MKPVIFMVPLSESLKKLKEVIEESAEENGIEIYEIEELEEAQKLLPQIGQSLVLSSHPKKCAMMLQKNRKVIKKLETKVILLSPKTIPRKTLDKFMKVGLTDCIVEPIPPKTLLYKVNLLIKSIANKKKVTEFKKKYGDEEEAQEQEEQNIRSLKKKRSQEEEPEQEIRDTKRAEEIKGMENLEGDVDKKENEIEGHYKGELERLEEEIAEDEEKKSKGYKEEAIDGHYKGDTETSEEYEGTLEGRSKKTQEEQQMEDYSRKQKAIEELEEMEKYESEQRRIDEEIAEKKKKKKKLELLDDEEDEDFIDEQEEEEEKGKINNKKSKLELEDDEEEDYLDEKEADEEIGKINKKKSKLELEDDEEEDYLDEKEEDEEIQAKDKKQKLELLDDEDEQEQTQEGDQEKHENLSGETETGADHIDKYYKSDLEKSEDEEAPAEDFLDKKEKLELIDDEEDLYERDKQVQEDEIHKQAKKEKLELEDDDEDIYERDKYLSDDEVHKQAKMEKLLVEDDSEDYKKRDEDESNVDENDIYKREKLTKLDVEDDTDREFENVSDEGEEFKKKKLASLEVEDDEFKRKKVNARADKIQGHYSNKKSVKHNDQDWSGLGNDKKEQVEEEEKTTQERELIMEGKDDLGEQTINYKKLKDEFGGITYDKLPEKKKKDYRFKDGEVVKKKFFKTVVNENGEEETIEVEEELTEEDLEVKNPIFEPVTNGLDRVLHVLEMYYEKDVKEEDIISYITNQIHEFSGGISVVYMYDPASKELEEVTNTFDDYGNEELNLEYWAQLKEENFARWMEINIPKWSDNTFQRQEIEFVFPYFEGTKNLGFAIVNYYEGFKEEDAKTIEILLESLRGLYLERYHTKSGERGEYKGSSNKEEKPKEKKKGLFAKLFGKKAS